LLGDHYDKLVELGFEFIEHDRAPWVESFQQLVDFYREHHGHFDAPVTNKALQRWVFSGIISKNPQL
jgi:hypothetical protein